MSSTTAVILDKRIKKKDDTYAIKLRITYKRDQRYYPLGIHLNAEDWEKVQQSNPRGHLKQVQLICNRIEQKAVEIIRELPEFSFLSFDRKFLVKTSTKEEDIFSYFETYIAELYQDERIGTADSYNNALVSFTNFLSDKRRKSLPFEIITPEFLKRYENWMKDIGNSTTTTGIYLRSLRTILNRAIEDGLMKNEDYPFGARKYIIPAARNIKKALPKADLKKIVDYVTVNNAEAKSRDLWLFSYLSNGANIKDISLLKNKNLSYTSIQFIRSKTERSTKQDLRPIVVMRIPKIDEIINKWGSKTEDPDDYVFGLIDKNDSAIRRKAKNRQTIKTINSYMKRIGEKLKLEIDLTTYAARHSFATIMKRSGASKEMISESLGHKNQKTTDNYLDSFEDDVKTAFQHKLMEF